MIPAAVSERGEIGRFQMRINFLQIYYHGCCVVFTIFIRSVARIPIFLYLASRLSTCAFRRICLKNIARVLMPEFFIRV